MTIVNLPLLVFVYNFIKGNFQPFFNQSHTRSRIHEYSCRTQIRNLRRMGTESKVILPLLEYLILPKASYLILYILSFKWTRKKPSKRIRFLQRWNPSRQLRMSMPPFPEKLLQSTEALTDDFEKINTDPYGAAWMIKIEMSNPSELDALLDAAAYEKSCHERESLTCSYHIPKQNGMKCFGRSA